MNPQIAINQEPIGEVSSSLACTYEGQQKVCSDSGLNFGKAEIDMLNPKLEVKWV